MMLFAMNEAFAEACFWNSCTICDSKKDWVNFADDFIAMYCGM